MPRHPDKPCESCGKDHTPVRRHQKFCRPCRLLSDLDYWNEMQIQPSKCAGCTKGFYRTNRKTCLCGICDPGFPNTARLQCLVCGSSERGLERSHTPVCRFCARFASPVVRKEARLRLREHLGLDTPQEHPLAVLTREKAVQAAERLGCTVAEAIAQAKQAIGVDPDRPTNKLDELIVALTQLKGRPAV